MTKPELHPEPHVREKTSKLSTMLESRLTAYAAAAGAAGVGWLALAPPAEAHIVYTPAHVKIVNSSSYLVLNAEGVPDFVVSSGYGSSRGNFGCGLAVRAVEKNGFVETSATYFRSFNAAADLPPGARIPPANASHGFKDVGVLFGFSFGVPNSRRFGKWRIAKDRYLGFKFETRGKTHYGWARMSRVNYQCEGVLTGYAYETIPNKPIITGKTKGSDVITVQPASLGHLARGANSIPAWRVKQVAATTH